MNGEKIEERLFQLVKSYKSELGINGNVYYRGLRPIKENSSQYKEDAVVAFLSGSSGDVQQGSCVINVYVSDVLGARSGLYLKNKERCEHIAEVLERFASFANKNESELFFKQSEVTYTFAEEELHQHYVSLKLDFKVFNTNY